MGSNQYPVAVVFGDRVKHFRLRNGLSQATLSEKAGISQTYLSALERGIKFPAGENIEALARELDVPYFELFVDPTAQTIPQGFLESEDFVQKLQEGFVAISREWVERQKTSRTPNWPPKTE